MKKCFPKMLFHIFGPSNLIGYAATSRRRLKTKRTLRTLAALLPIAAASPALAAEYKTLDYPGSASTAALGIDGKNIVGSYIDSSGHSHGFLYNGVTYSTLDDPLGTQGIFPQAISGGNIVGEYDDSSAKGHGFLYNGTTFTTIDDPLTATQIPGEGTGATGIPATRSSGTTSVQPVTNWATSRRRRLHDFA